MTSRIVRSRKEWLDFKKMMEGKVDTAPYKPMDYAPLEYPVLCVSVVDNKNGLWTIETEFFYRSDVAPLCKP